MKGKISSLESFGALDGPGIRYIIFLKGCPFRCLYCHNPETWSKDDIYKEVEAKELIKRALNYKEYWGKKGGITVSGGEPLLQIDFLIELFKIAKSKGINTAIDTSGATFTLKNKEWLKKFDELLLYTDLILLDIKQIDEKKHIQLVGASNKCVLEMATYLSKKKIPMWIRHVLVPSYTDNDEDLIKLKEFIDTLTNVERVEVLPYHDLGMIKYEELGLPYALKGIDPPSKERVENAKKILDAR